MEAISREGRKVEGGTKSAKALFLFLPACFERDIERWRSHFTVALNLLQSFDVTLGIFSRGPFLFAML